MQPREHVLRAMWTTMRPYLMFVSAITGLAGVAASTAAAPVRLVGIFVASFFSYGFGQALTDCFQTDTDAISAPYRPLAAGAVSHGSILLLSLAGLATCVTVFTLANPWTLPLGLLAGAGLATYTPFKRRWWGGPWYNAWIVVCLFVLGYLAGSGPGARWENRLLPLGATVFFGYANFVLSGYFKDIEADRQTGYRTLPVVFGRSVAAYASDALALSFLASAVWTAVTLMAPPVPVLPAAGGVILMGLGFLQLLVGQSQLHRNTDDEDAHRPILRVVHAYILVLSGLVVLFRPEWLLFLLLHYAAFTYVVGHRPEVTQI